MGLFSAVLHLRSPQRAPVLKALEAGLDRVGFHLDGTSEVPLAGPYSVLPERPNGSVFYLAAPHGDPWLAIIDPQSGAGPHLADIAQHLSLELGTYALVLMVHDDDLLLYDLFLNGDALDGYNSCPQYFEQQRLSRAEVESQRHQPEVFEPLLPPGIALDQLTSLLNEGWWNAHDQGRLDEYGVETEPGDHSIFESDRMTALGNLLGLAGPDRSYPYAAWADSPEIAWPNFVLQRYRGDRS